MKDTSCVKCDRFQDLVLLQAEENPEILVQKEIHLRKAEMSLMPVSIVWYYVRILSFSVLNNINCSIRFRHDLLCIKENVLVLCGPIP